MTDEERKAAKCENMRRYRLRHKNDPVYKARVREEKRKQLAKHTPERRKAAANARRKRYREKHKDEASYKEKNIASAKAWRKKNPGTWHASRDAWDSAHPELMREYCRKHRDRNPGYDAAKAKEYALAHVDELKAYRKAHAAERNANCAAYQQRKRGSMPPWADRSAIATFYLEAKRRTKETGVPHHVDHIIPLNHDLVSGLHVPANLQILPGVENIRKSNRFSVDI